MKAKLDFDPVLEKHYFAHSEVSEMTRNVIPRLQMDMTFLVVDVQGFRLLINEGGSRIFVVDADDPQMSIKVRHAHSVIGYNMVHRALLEATGELWFKIFRSILFKVNSVSCTLEPPQRPLFLIPRDS